MTRRPFAKAIAFIGATFLVFAAALLAFGPAGFPLAFWAVLVPAAAWLDV